MKILGTGLQGLVGSRFVQLLPSDTFENISRTTGIDITDKDAVRSTIEKSDASVVLHLAAKADVDGCETDKPIGIDGDAWKINVAGTRNIVSACEQTGKKLIYISTDFVFNGEKEYYDEEDTPDPKNWYAQTKYEGEKIVAASQTPWAIARISYPFRSAFPKNDFVRAVKSRLEQKLPLTMVTDHIMTPTYIDDIVLAVEKLMKTQASGIYHVVGSEWITPYDAATVIADTFGYGKEQIGKTTREEFFAGRAPRPFRLALKNDKIRELGVTMSSFREGLGNMKSEL